MFLIRDTKTMRPKDCCSHYYQKKKNYICELLFDTMGQALFHPVIFTSPYLKTEEFKVTPIEEIYKRLTNGVDVGTKFIVYGMVTGIDLNYEWRYIQCTIVLSNGNVTKYGRTYNRPVERSGDGKPSVDERLLDKTWLGLPLGIMAPEVYKQHWVSWGSSEFTDSKLMDQCLMGSGAFDFDSCDSDSPKNVNNDSVSLLVGFLARRRMFRRGKVILWTSFEEWQIRMIRSCIMLCCIRNA
ncbi:hypothetical protein Tco_0886615 [Tanacetum coccineum]